MSGHLSTWRCPECGGTTYSWYFDAPDGSTLCADIDTVPDMDGLAEAKAKALKEWEELNESG
jgi:hypothetical protein